MQQFLRKTLKNGITLLFEERDLPIVSLSITNKFGAAYENSENKGVAHVIEHVLFTGTEKRTSEEISREIEKRGGILNAFTSHEITSFWFKLPSEHLFTGLDILTDILKNPKFDFEKFEKEKKVILEEIKMYNDNPRTAVLEQIEKNLYEKPFGELVIGSKETVNKLNVAEVKKIFLENYNPKNYIVTIVGKADIEAVSNYLEKEFKSTKNETKQQKVKTRNAETTEERPGIDQAHFVLALHAPFPNTKEYATLEIIDLHLAYGMSSKLFIEIREKRGLAYTIRSSIDSEKNYSYYSIYTGTTKEAIPEVKKIILDEIKNIENLNEKQLNEAKEALIGLKKVSSEESINVMNKLLFSEIANKAEDYYNYEEKIKAVSLKDVKDFAKKLSQQKYSTASIIPK